jgi:hypothetical protein
MTLDDNEGIVSPTGLEDVLMNSGQQYIEELVVDKARWVYDGLPCRKNATSIIGWV